ncbi:MAG: endonuclease/exonuclease/phosphatase family protein [Deltaproteobacteria bacterium]|jgi:endonuclease/exonuclease/phosphatase family metal-dependent hydrolase|nr:endonuclease/exonuclease/phosphatase family protein [Deltaproteobacteria bacterium]
MNGRADPAAFADLVRRSGADVVVAQELAPEQARALGDVLPHGRFEPARDFTGMGIALRHPADFDRVPLAYRDARIARLDSAHWPALAGGLEIVNVHMASPAFGAQAWARFRHRRKQCRGLVEYLDATPGRTRAVLGDFNATPSWPLYRVVAARLEDLALSHARSRGARPARTWARWVDGPPLLRIDHCFGSGLRVDDFQVVAIRGSDHSGLVVDLSLDEPAASGR